MRTALQTCDLSYVLCGIPVWQHIYHTLHSCDRWYINPAITYAEPSFHVDGMNSLDTPSEAVLSKDILISYLNSIETTVQAYLLSLRDEQLPEKPLNCSFTRMELIIGQIRHFCVHLGNINATTIIQTGNWPRVVGLEDTLSDSLYE